MQCKSDKYHYAVHWCDTHRPADEEHCDGSDQRHVSN